MARARSPKRDDAYNLWFTNKLRPLKDIAAEVGVSESQIRKWKSVDEWEKGIVTLPMKGSVTNTAKKLIKAVEQNEQLTEKEKAFCLHWVKSFNASAAARAAGYEPKYANRIGWELLQKPHIKAEVERLKQLRNLTMMAGVDDFVELHMRIAFADITEYVSFGREAVPVMGMFGPVEVEDKDGKKVPLEKDVNVVRFAESSEVDGQLISKVKQGKDSVSVELVDRQKSLAFLERYFEANPMDRHKMAFENARLELERQKAKATDPEPTGDDGFMTALNAAAEEVWADEAGDIPV